MTDLLTRRASGTGNSVTRPSPCHRTGTVSARAPVRTGPQGAIASSTVTHARPVERRVQLGFLRFE